MQQAVNHEPIRSRFANVVISDTQWAFTIGTQQQDGHAAVLLEGYHSPASKHWVQEADLIPAKVNGQNVSQDELQKVRNLKSRIKQRWTDYYYGKTESEEAVNYGLALQSRITLPISPEAGRAMQDKINADVANPPNYWFLGSPEKTRCVGPISRWKRSTPIALAGRRLWLRPGNWPSTHGSRNWASAAPWASSCSISIPRHRDRSRKNATLSSGKKN